MAVTLAASKGQTKDPRLNVILRSTAAHVLVMRVRSHVRWIPSERNPSDVGSRAYENATSETRLPYRHLRYPGARAVALDRTSDVSSSRAFVDPGSIEKHFHKEPHSDSRSCAGERERSHNRHATDQFVLACNCLQDRAAPETLPKIMWLEAKLPL